MVRDVVSRHRNRDPDLLQVLFLRVVFFRGCLFKVFFAFFVVTAQAHHVLRKTQNTWIEAGLSLEAQLISFSKLGHGDFKIRMSHLVHVVTKVGLVNHCSRGA